MNLPTNTQICLEIHCGGDPLKKYMPQVALIWCTNIPQCFISFNLENKMFGDLQLPRNLRLGHCVLDCIVLFVLSYSQWYHIFCIWLMTPIDEKNYNFQLNIRSFLINTNTKNLSMNTKLQRWRVRSRKTPPLPFLYHMRGNFNRNCSFVSIQIQNNTL